MSWNTTGQDQAMRVLDDQRLSYFKILGMASLGGEARIEDYMLELEQSFPRAHVTLRFLFVRDPIRLCSKDSWPNVGSEHPVSLALQKHLDHASASIKSTYEACYLVIETKDDVDLHHTFVNRLQDVLRAQIIRPCTWMEYEDELARPALDVDPMHSKADRAMSFPKLVDAIGPTIPWRMRYSVDINHPLAVKMVRSERRKDKLLRLLGARARVAPAYQQLMDEDSFTWVVCDLKIETWGKTPEHEQRNYVQIHGVLSDGSFKRALDYPVMQLDEAISLMPIYRPGSPWEDGEIQFQTRDRKPFPYTQLWPHRYSNTDLVFAKDEKDIQAYRLAADVGVIASSHALPKLSRVQIGNQSDPLQDLVSNEFPDKAQDLISQVTAAADDSFCVNIFDTSLGYRHAEADGDEAGAFLMSMFSRVLREHYGAHAAELLRMLVTATYTFVSKEACPKMYVKGVDRVVDAELSSRCYADHPVTWWDVADVLFMQQCYEAAALAQRHAVPVMADMVSVLRSDMVIRDHWKKGTECDDCGFSADRFADTLDALISAWSALSAPTRLDIKRPELAMIVTVNAGNAEVAEKVDCLTGALYLLARKAVSADYFCNPFRYGNTSPDVTDGYHQYHSQRLQDAHAKGLVKKITYSNVEKLRDNTAASEQLIYDMREGRKLGVTLTLESSRPFENNFYWMCGSSITLSPEAFSKEELIDLPVAQMSAFADRFTAVPRGLNVSINATLALDHSLQQNLVLPLEGILSKRD